MTTLDLAQKITDLIDARPRRIDLDALLYEINMLTKGAPTKRVPKGGWETYADVMATLRDSKSNDSKNSKRASAISSFAKKIIPLINSRPRFIKLDKLLYAIYVKADLAESEREIKAGRGIPHELVMKRMWKHINSILRRHGLPRVSHTAS
jgi:hypothetical protein